MAYWPTRQKLRAWEPTLEAIKKGLESGIEIEFESDLDSLKMDALKIREALYSADYFPDELGGRYVGLRAQVTVKAVPPDKIKVFAGSRGSPAKVAKSVDDERLYYAALRTYTGNLFSLEFKPSREFDERVFRGLVRALDWSVELIEPLEDGSLRVTSGRITNEEDQTIRDFSVEGLLERHGYKRAKKSDDA